MDKSRPKPNQGSSWNDEQDKITNPNKRQEEDQESNVESPRSGQRASRTDSGSSESLTEDGEHLHGDRQTDRQTDTSRRERSTE